MQPKHQYGIRFQLGVESELERSWTLCTSLSQVLLLSRLLSGFSSLHYSAHPARVCGVHTRTPTKWQALSDSRDLDSRVMYMRGRGISKDQIIAPRPVEDGTRTRRETTGNTYIPIPLFPILSCPFLYTYLRAPSSSFSDTLARIILSFSRSSSIVCPMTGELVLGKRIVINEHSSFVLVVILHLKHLHTKRISMREKYYFLSLFIIIGTSLK